MKLVRDGIPAYVAAKGEAEPFRQVVDDAEHAKLLDEKFDEELREWRRDGDPMELADLLAVVRDTAIRHGILWAELLGMEERKREEFGGFLGGVVWLGEPRHPYDRALPPEPELVRGVNEVELRPGLSTRFGYCPDCGDVYPPDDQHPCGAES